MRDVVEAALLMALCASVAVAFAMGIAGAVLRYGVR
jgi:hypothetical protein